MTHDGSNHIIHVIDMYGSTTGKYSSNIKAYICHSIKDKASNFFRFHMMSYFKGMKLLWRGLLGFNRKKMMVLSLIDAHLLVLWENNCFDSLDCIVKPWNNRSSIFIRSLRPTIVRQLKTDHGSGSLRIDNVRFTGWDSHTSRENSHWRQTCF